MRPAARLRFAGAAVLLTFTGVWSSHALEMLRVLGTGALAPALTRPVHAYMVPVGLGLAVISVAAGVRAAWLWRRLGSMLDATAMAVRATLGTAPPRRTRRPSTPPSLSPSTPSSLLLLWLPLSALQMAVYIVQENLEYRAAGLDAPGVGVLSGVHWAAPLIHLYVAFVLAASTLLVQRLVRRRAAAVSAVTRLLRVLVERAARASARTWSVSAAHSLARRRLAHAMWCRPPPARFALIHLG